MTWRKAQETFGANASSVLELLEFDRDVSVERLASGTPSTIS
jgi:hypothetical protein